ncbi:hypothetical protein LTR20_003789 [Exophiala xenobiotica]|nr:hypothetical protein LTS13_005746 [Exophiala xenobiotica]KAK5402227.1 hypothetical protein LTR79_000955 [Exophiala xenobiotica]KAK5419353.1 hypothetical protein LTR90_004416 [Exophiala xenobiotica]KAK5466842.1 hypothetical protein LTR20_003789 [Exophiala xenobiotica]KAK5488034.1 hypothetical protein LTR83_007670 [Exophiala xenobiotica]
MSKSTIRQEESAEALLTGSSSHHESSRFAEPTTLHKLPSTSDEASTRAREVQAFVKAHGLSHRLDVFQKAATLIQGDDDSDGPQILTSVERDALHDETARKWRQPKKLYFTILVCSIGAIEQGWAQTGMNGANLYFPAAFGVGSDSKHDNFIVGLINSGIYLSTGLLGAWLSDPVNHRLGRRGAVLTGSILCLIANLGSGISANWPQLLFFRLILGLGLGINASTVSVWAAESAPKQIRGGLAVSWQMNTAFGIFLGFVANAAVYNVGPSAWRWQLAGPAIPTVPLAAMIYLCPESPSWYQKHGRYDKAFRSLCTLRNTELQAAKELYTAYHLQGRVRAKARAKPKMLSEGEFSESGFFTKVTELFTIPRIRRATTASYVVMLSQQLCGINIISFYSSTIFSDAGFSLFGALLASCVFGFLNFLGAFPAVWTMDTLGRRSLLLLTLPVMAITMFATGLSFNIPADNPAHFGLLATLIYAFCLEYSPGMGPVPNTYSAEVFPLSHREVGMGFAVATANFWAAVLSLTFPRILTALGSQGAFSLYAILNVVAFLLIFLLLPETRMKTLDELDEVFSIPTSAFVRYQVTEYLPWFVRSTLEAEYRELEQEEEEEDQADGGV